MNFKILFISEERTVLLVVEFISRVCNRKNVTTNWNTVWKRKQFNEQLYCMLRDSPEEWKLCKMENLTVLEILDWKAIQEVLNLVNPVVNTKLVIEYIPWYGAIFSIYLSFRLSNFQIYYCHMLWTFTILVMPNIQKSGVSQIKVIKPSIPFRNLSISIICSFHWNENQDILPFCHQK